MIPRFRGISPWMSDEAKGQGLSKGLPGFVEPMLCEPVKALPEGAGWVFEVKLDGFRVLAVKPEGQAVTLVSRNGNSLNRKFFYIADALSFLPEGTVLDGELIALDPKGRSSFRLLQFFRGQAANVRYSAFDLMRLAGEDVTGLPLVERKRLLAEALLGQGDPVRVAEFVEGDATEMLRRVREQGLEGVIAKRADSRYEAGERSGAWVKHRVNKGQEFVVGGYVRGVHGFDALVIGYYRGADLVYVHRLRNGFTPALREEITMRFAGLETEICPFVNLPQEGAKSRWGGEGFTAEKMKAAVWLRPEMVVQVEFVEWSSEMSLRHATFIGVRDDKAARDVVKEG